MTRGDRVAPGRLFFFWGVDRFGSHCDFDFVPLYDNSIASLYAGPPDLSVSAAPPVTTRVT
jgi:hypothetical protein